MWSWIAASVRGTSHERSGTRLQDAKRCFSSSSGDCLVAVVCDGAGSASHGGEGAALCSRILSSRALEYLRKECITPDDALIEEWIDDVRDSIARAAAARSLSTRDFATTLVAAISCSEETLTLHVGDGAIVAKTGPSDEWVALSWPEHGEYASTTFFVTDDESARLRISRSSMPIKELVLFSDGLERLALDFQENKPHGPFFSPFSLAVKSGDDGYQSGLSRELKKFLNSDPVNERTDDDKSLIVAVRK